MRSCTFFFSALLFNLQLVSIHMILVFKHEYWHEIWSVNSSHQPDIENMEMLCVYMCGTFNNTVIYVISYYALKIIMPNAYDTLKSGFRQDSYNDDAFFLLFWDLNHIFYSVINRFSICWKFQHICPCCTLRKLRLSNLWPHPMKMWEIWNQPISTTQHGTAWSLIAD